MAETIQEPIQEPIAPTPPPTDPFKGAWSETPPAAVEQPQATPPVVTPPVIDDKSETEEVVDVIEFVKREYGWDDPEMGKKELAELRAKAQTPAEIKFANEASEKFFNYLKDGKEDDIYSFLDTKRKLSAAEKLDAAAALKLHISQTNKHYTQADVEDVFEEKYSIPKKPTQGDDEDVAEYNSRVAEWQTGVDKINRRIERDAISAKQELAKLNSELILPDIKKDIPAQQQTSQAELDRVDALRSEYLKRLESDYKNFNGYEIKYKDEEVEIPVSFGVSDEEKVALKKELESFDVDGFITSRWFDATGNPNISQIMDDVTLLRNKEKVFQKMINEVGSKMKEHYIQLKSNISLNGGQPQTVFQPKTTQQNGKAANPFSSGAWSETPPTITQN